MGKQFTEIPQDSASIEAKTKESNIVVWDRTIKAFNDLIQGFPAAKTIEKELLAMKESASLSNTLNIRQKDAIVARCDNYLNGTYGDTKTEEQMKYGTK